MNQVEVHVTYNYNCHVKTEVILSKSQALVYNMKVVRGSVLETVQDHHRKWCRVTLSDL